MDRVINMLKQKYDYPVDDIKVSSIGKLEVIDFDIADDRKVIVLIDTFKGFFTYDYYDVYNGSLYKQTDSSKWARVETCWNVNTLDELIKQLDLFMSYHY